MKDLKFKVVIIFNFKFNCANISPWKTTSERRLSVLLIPLVLTHSVRFSVTTPPTSLMNTTMFIIFLPLRFIPESVRWLLVSGRRDEARQILEKVARVNKKEMPKEELHVPVRSQSSKGFFELFKTWKLAKLSLIQCYAWFVRFCE